MSLYLDTAASSSLDSRVLKAMAPYLSEQYGNPSSPHALGERAAKALVGARTLLAQKLGARAHELIFTSGTSESDSWALQGLARAYPKKKRIVVSALEHAAVMETCEYLKTQGYTIVIAPVNREGIVELSFIEHQLKKHSRQTLVVSVMHASNVLGTIQPIAAVGALCRKHDVLFHTDAAQTFAKLDIDVRTMKIDLLSASAHKINGPKGVGLLYVRDGIKIEPLIFGGGQERGLRGGTENVPGVVGFAKAAELFDSKKFLRLVGTKERLIRLLEALGATINGSRNGLSNIIHASFSEMDARLLVAYLSQKGMYISTGSACESKSGKEEASLRAIGLTSAEIRGSVRFSLEKALTDTEIEHIKHELSKALKVLR